MKKIWWATALFLIAFAVFLTLFMTKQKAHADFPNITYCGVAFKDPVYEFKDASGHSLFVLDVNGNLYIYPETIHIGNAPPSQTPTAGLGFKYNNIQKMTVDSTNFYISGRIAEDAINLPDIPQSHEIIFKEPLTQTPIARFDGITGTLDIKGKAIYNGAQSNCTSDHYYTSSGNILWKDFYCNKPSCLFNSIDLDSSMALCQTNDSKWNIGGEVDPTTCCRNDNSGVNLSCRSNPSSLCSGNTLGEACCNLPTDCVYQNTCYTAGTNCAPWNSNYLATCTSNVWSYPTNYDCDKECVNICQVRTQCLGGSCTGTANCAVGTKCVDHNGCQTGQCNTHLACSIGEGDGNYNVAGRFNCLATCDNSGNCDYAAQCTDCSNLGSVNGCACSCAGYGAIESIANGNCDDHLNGVDIDNDCDGLANENDPNCCNDKDGDGWGVGTSYLVCPHNSAVDCNDNDTAVNPGVHEAACDNIDHDCDGGKNTDRHNPGIPLTTIAGCNQIGCCINSYKTCLADGTWTTTCSFTPSATNHTTACITSPIAVWDWNCDGIITKQSFSTWRCAIRTCRTTPVTCECGVSCVVNSCDGDVDEEGRPFCWVIDGTPFIGGCY